ncbi:unnamed protein product [Brassicogethes aeneus]|uniref:DUF659 domain-containing protein n=1 Tax=Brassicogethes aeneus TaxID=1431903 RepID=A0A9P0ASM6_BRAAE|nr:unnamed protein product [Brassicogethes aeneus]
MVNLLRPGCKPPNKKDLAGDLLDEAAEKVDHQIIEDISQDNRPITVLQDGWSSVNNDLILAISIHTGMRLYLIVSAKDCGEEKKTAEYCTEIAWASIKKCEQKIWKTCFCLCNR